MTKNGLAVQIYATIDNGIFIGDSKTAIIKGITSLLDILEYKFPSEQHVLKMKEIAQMIHTTVIYYKLMNCNDITMFTCIEGFLNKLKPKDLISFSGWGQPKEQSTIDKCWL